MAEKINELIQKLQSGNRLALAQTITLLESERREDQVIVDDLMKVVHSLPQKSSLRIGISGAPGAGKSSLIEKMGLQFIAKNKKVAVLAIDPSSEVTFGSVLGDKTRMEELSVKDEAFIRPSASRGHLGGVSVATHDVIKICEIAGYDIVIVETVGVGQSESQVADLIDIFCLVVNPGAGDELQGIKRGVLEKIDMVLVNKCDGENKIAAQVAEKQLKSSLHILRQKEIPIYLTSAIYNFGIVEFCEAILTDWTKRMPLILEQRNHQEVKWVYHYLQQFLRLEVQKKLDENKQISDLEKSVRDGKCLPREAARRLLGDLIK